MYSCNQRQISYNQREKTTRNLFIICCKIMKYLAEPHMNIIDYELGREKFQFDENGEYETEDEKLIDWMKKNKGFIKCENNTLKCKKCGQEFENKGLLMAHYRQHKKEERGE